jgi:Ca-activated chloride channel family protein
MGQVRGLIFGTIAAVVVTAGIFLLLQYVVLVEPEPADPKPEQTTRENSGIDITRADDAEVGAMAPPPDPRMSSPQADISSGPSAPPPRPENREQYEDVEPNPVKVTAEEPVSTFSIDVDTASYSVMRSYLNRGTLPPRDAIRIEELVNYFSYNYPLPEDQSKPFEPTVTVAPMPWNAETKLMRIGIKGYDIEPDATPALNLVMLLDVSGSMNQPNKLPLLKQAMALLVDSLDEDDRVSIVVYAGASGVILEPTPGDQHGVILGALEKLSAGGSTAGGEGIRLAYSLAERNFEEGKVNRVMLATDGDFNVGITNSEQLEDFVARKRETGVFLTVMGFGRGNYNDALMQKLAQAGNGHAVYIDSLMEAQKVLVNDLRATLFPIAKDVKIQVEFNPKAVVEYRLIGYETRLLNREDFNNDEVDAGEIGSGHTVTALYEIVPVGSPARLTDPLRYQSDDPIDVTDPQALEYGYVRVRYKLPDEDESNLIAQPVLTGDALPDFGEADEDMRFAAAVAAFGQKLRGDPYLKEMDYDRILEIAAGAKGIDEFGYRAEFTRLVRLAKSAQAQEPLP